MSARLGRIVMGLLALAMVLAFFAAPALKLKEPALIVVMLIGVGAMVWNFVEVVAEGNDST